jgi:peptidoglycan hydrolase CwlO-like protein
MKQELEQLIQQHLPALAAGEMKAYIENAESDKRELQQFKSSHKTISDIKENLEKEISKLRSEASSVEKKSQEINEKEKLLNQKEFNLKVEELKYQLQAEKESKDSIFKLVSTFVANPRAIEVTSRNRTYNNATDYSPSGGTIHYPTSSYEFENKEIKEEK